MFPFVYDFQWTPVHLTFLGVFFTVLTVIGCTLVYAFWRTRREQPHAARVRWHAEFDDLPAREQICRHELTGEFPARQCDKAFDCRHCATHAQWIAEHPSGTGTGYVEVAGMRYPLDRLYSRGHVWVRAEPDGTLALGTDELARRFLGDRIQVQLPAPGSKLEAYGPAWFIRVDGDEFRVLSPVDGDVVEQGAPDHPFWLRVRPTDPNRALVPLLRGPEVAAWLTREIDRVHRCLTDAAGVSSLADGGVLLENPASALDSETRSAVRGAILLEP